MQGRNVVVTFHATREAMSNISLIVARLNKDILHECLISSTGCGKVKCFNSFSSLAEITGVKHTCIARINHHRDMRIILQALLALFVPQDFRKWSLTFTKSGMGKQRGEPSLVSYHVHPPCKSFLRQNTTFRLPNAAESQFCASPSKADTSGVRTASAPIMVFRKTIPACMTDLVACK